MDYLIVTIRVFTIFPLFFFLTLLMGKRQVGELTVIDFIIVITIGSVVGADIADPSIHHGPTALAIILIAIFQIIVSWVKTKSRLFNHWITFEPTIMIQNGQILRSHLKQNRITLDHLVEMLREKNIFNINEVEFAILEPSGTLSVLKKAQYDVPTIRDLGLHAEYKGVATPIIVEGKPFLPGLRFTTLDETTLLNALKGMDIHGFEDVFFASMNTDGSFHISLYTEPHKEQVFRF